MNRLVNEALANEAATGKRVAVLTSTADIKDLMHALRGDPRVTRVNLSTRSQRIDYEGGGCILPVGSGYSLRGMVPDLLYVDVGRWTPEVAQHVAPMSSTRTGLAIEVIRA